MGTGGSDQPPHTHTHTENHISLAILVRAPLKKQLDPSSRGEVCTALSYACADPESLVSGGPNLTFFVVVFPKQIPLEAGHHRPASEAFRWGADDGPTMTW